MGEAAQPVGTCGEDQPIPPGKAHWPGLLPLEQEQSLAEEGDFEVFATVIPASDCDQVEHEGEESREDEPEHHPSQSHGFPSAYHPLPGTEPIGRHQLVELDQP
jgi:hypothetical protein